MRTNWPGDEAREQSHPVNLLYDHKVVPLRYGRRQ